MTFKDVVIWNLDGQPDLTGEFISPDVDLTFQKEVTVMTDREDPKYVGVATNIRKNDDKLIADIEVRSEEVPFVVLRHLKPCVSGSVMERNGKNIKKAMVKSIALAAYNADKRIKPLSDFETSK